MKRQLITTSRSVENKIKNQGSKKISHFNQAKALVELALDKPVTDLDRFSEGFTDYLYEELKAKHKGALDNVSYVQMITLNSINDEHIKRHQIEYKKLSNIKLNKDYSGLAPYDCGVYAETKEEIERLKQYQDIEKAVSELIKKGIPIHYGNLSRAFYPITAIDGQKLTPNVNYIKGSTTH